MSTAEHKLPVLTDVVADEKGEQTVLVPTIVTTTPDIEGKVPPGYDPYDNAPPVVDVRNRD